MNEQLIKNVEYEIRELRSKLLADTPEMRSIHLKNLALREAHLARLKR
jgi:hypothetical protein